MINNLTAVVLAGGVGKRFWPFCQDKNFIKFFGNPFIKYTFLDSIPEAVTKIVIIANSHNYQKFHQLKYPVDHTIIVQKSPKGMADAIVSARHELLNSRLLIFIADHYADKDMFEKVIKLAHKKDVFGVIPGLKVKSYFPGGYLAIKDDRVVDIIEKPDPALVPSNLVNITGHYISDSGVLIHELRKTTSREDDIYEKALSKLMKKLKFQYFSYQGPSFALKYPWDILNALSQLLNLRKRSYRGNNVEIHKNVILDGPVYISKNVKIFENTKITGPVYIGENTIIGNNNLIRESHIGAGCVTGFNTEITRSYVGDNCWFHSNYIGDSVLEESVSLGSGAVLANLRLDQENINCTINDKKISSGLDKLGTVIGKNVQIGTNSSIMPGVFIGKNSFISSQTLINRNIPDDSYAETQSELIILNNVKKSKTASKDKFRSKL